MGEYTLVDCETGLIYGPYETCAMARAHAEHEAIAIWEIITSDEKLVDWRAPQRPALQAFPPLGIALARGSDAAR